MDHFRALRTFIAVADHGGFAEAARRLPMSPAAVTRTIAALERSLGVPLFVRTTRSVRLTEDGATFLERCRASMTGIDEAFDVVRGGAAKPHGTLTITAPVVFGRLHILPIIIELLTNHPQLNVRLLLLDRITNLVEEGIDVAVRIGDLPDSSLRMVKLSSVRSIFSASPAYLRDHGEPRNLDDLEGHTFIAIDDDFGSRRPLGAERRQKGTKGATRLSVNSVDAAISAAVAGLGIVRSLSYQAAQSLADGQLQQVLQNEVSRSIPVSLLFRDPVRQTANVRAFVSLVRERLPRV